MRSNNPNIDSNIDTKPKTIKKNNMFNKFNLKRI